MVNRLNQFIANYIHTNQTNLIPNRNLVDKICKTLNSINYCKAKLNTMNILALDIDKLEVQYLTTLLQCMGFGEKFSKVFKLFMCQPRPK